MSSGKQNPIQCAFQKPSKLLESCESFSSELERKQRVHFTVDHRQQSHSIENDTKKEQIWLPSFVVKMSQQIYSQCQGQQQLKYVEMIQNLHSYISYFQ